MTAPRDNERNQEREERRGGAPERHLGPGRVGVGQRRAAGLEARGSGKGEVSPTVRTRGKGQSRRHRGGPRRNRRCDAERRGGCCTRGLDGCGDGGDRRRVVVSGSLSAVGAVRVGLVWEVGYLRISRPIRLHGRVSERRPVSGRTERFSSCGLWRIRHKPRYADQP